jgi:hypothetical protein
MEWKGKQIKINKLKIEKLNTRYKIQIPKYNFSRTKFNHKPTSKVGTV